MRASQAENSSRSCKPDWGMTPKPRHSESQGSYIQPSRLGRAAPLFCNDAGIAVFKERLSLRELGQDDGKGREQFFGCKAGNDAGHPLLHHGFAGLGAHDGIDVTGIQESIGTAFMAS